MHSSLLNTVCLVLHFLLRYCYLIYKMKNQCNPRFSAPPWSQYFCIILLVPIYFAFYYFLVFQNSVITCDFMHFLSCYIFCCHLLKEPRTPLTCCVVRTHCCFQCTLLSTKIHRSFPAELLHNQSDPSLCHCRGYSHSGIRFCSWACWIF